MDGRVKQLNLRSKAVDAQRSAVQGLKELQRTWTYPGIATLLTLGAALVLSPAACAAHPGGKGAASGEAVGTSAIAGVVRDSQGVAQMGALVQVLAADSMTVATAFTDQHGRYSISKLNPGKYLVRASATLFVPATHSNLQLRTGATAVVNLTLSALFDTASWLPAQRRRADETEDDWKWTLRSTANRPILRIIEEGQAIEISSSATEAPARLRVKAAGAVESGDGEFGGGGVHNIVTIHRAMEDGSDMMFRADLGTATGATSGEPAGPGGAGSEIDAGFEGRTGFGSASRMVASYESHPELVGAGCVPGFAGGSGVQVLELTSAQRMSLGERVEVEAGGRMQAVRAGASAVVMRPFLRVSAHPTGEWTLEYQLATDRGLQGFDDVTSGDADVPVALVRDGKLALESGHHQEVSVARRSGRASLQMAFYRDGIAQAEVAGAESSGAAAIGGSGAVANLNANSVLPDGAGEVRAGVPVGMLLDPTTGSFRALVGGYTGNGARFTASSALTPALWIAAEYSNGDAISSERDGIAGLPAGFSDALGSLKPHRSQTATIALKGKLLGSGTRVRASYRWQPVGDVTAVDPYSVFGDQAYLSCLIRQPIRLGRSGPQGLEATIDVTNLLAQGYRPFLSADGQTLYFAQAPRTIQAGLSFSF
jgi:hypothetical protein